MKGSFIKRIAFQSAFTLVEILVYAAILCILAGVTISFIFWTIQSNTKIKIIGETMGRANRVMEIMIGQIREAKSIYTPTTSSKQLSLETSNYLPDDEEKSYIDFFLSDGRIWLKREAHDPIALTPVSLQIINLNFVQVDSNSQPSVKVSFTASYNDPTGRPEYQASIDLVSTASLRPH